MKVAVLVKRVPDTASVFQIAQDGRSVEAAGLKYVMSPYDEHAVEEAIQLKESAGAEVTVVCLGPPEAKETLRTALAMGADAAVLITGEGVEQLSGRGTARALEVALRELSPDLVFAGKQAVDDDASQVPERVAERLGWSHASAITHCTIEGQTARVDREIEGGHYTLHVPMPAVLTTQKGINAPRYPTLPNIMKAKKKEIRQLELAGLDLSAKELASGLRIMALTLPRQDRLAKVLQGEQAEQVTELVRILREEEKVL